MVRRFACVHSGNQYVIQSKFVRLISLRLDSLFHSSASEFRHATNEWIEKIVIIGFPSKPSAVEIGETSLEFQFKEGALTIKKPAANVAQDFTIFITV